MTTKSRAGSKHAPFVRKERDPYEQHLLDRAAALLPASARTPTMSLEQQLSVLLGRRLNSRQ